MLAFLKASWVLCAMEPPPVLAFVHCQLFATSCLRNVLAAWSAPSPRTLRPSSALSGSCSRTHSMPPSSPSGPVPCCPSGSDTWMAGTPSSLLVRNPGNEVGGGSQGLGISSLSQDLLPHAASYRSGAWSMEIMTFDLVLPCYPLSL